MGVLSCCLPPWWSARQRPLPAPEGLNDAHGSATVGAWFAQGERDDLGGWRVFLLDRFRAEQTAYLRDVGLAAGTGQDTIVADAVETVGENVDQEATDELAGFEAHDLLSITCFDPVILPAEGYRFSISADQTAV